MAQREGMTSVRGRLPSAFEEDHSGDIWIGFEQGGLARYADDHFRVFTTSDGLPDGGISDLHVDRTGRLWVGTSRGGLARVDDPAGARPAFAAYSTAQGLSSDTVTAVTEDLYGRIYVATGRGLDRLSPSTGYVRHFTSADGLAAGEIRGTLRDRDGALWFGTRSGLLRYVPEQERPAALPSVFLTGLTIAGERQAISKLGETAITLPDLDHDRNQLQLSFVAISFAPGETLRYEYKLEPASDWSAPTDQRTINLASLAPGQYRFLVRALTSDGILSPAPAIVGFTVLAPMWQRWWFRSLVVVACGLMVHLLYRYRLSRLVELERVRTRIATDLHDEIGSNLSLIAMVSDVAVRGAKDADSHVAERLALSARTSRESVDAMSDIVWMVNPNRDRLGDLTQRMRRVAEDTCSAAHVALLFVAPRDESEIKLGVDTRREIFRIFKEALNNIVRHSRCTQARIELTLDSTWLQLRLSDNGRGFDATAASSGRTSRASMASARNFSISALNSGLLSSSESNSARSASVQRPAEAFITKSKKSWSFINYIAKRGVFLTTIHARLPTTVAGRPDTVSRKLPRTPSPRHAYSRFPRRPGHQCENRREARGTAARTGVDRRAHLHGLAVPCGGIVDDCFGNRLEIATRA
jgi:signal transduction histidine kinase